MKPSELKEALLEALEKSLGVITTACKSVGCSRSIFYKYMDKDPKFRLKVEEITDVSIDFVESQLFKRIQDGCTSSIIFFLKTKGKKRGYIEKQEIETSGEITQIVVENIGKGTPEI